MPDTPAPQTADDLALLLVQLGTEVAAPLAQALERLHQHMTQGDEAVNAALVSLREPLRRARDATLQAAQIGRLSSGRVVPAQESCALHTALHAVVEMRRREANSRGLQIRLDAGEAEAATDPALLPSLFHALLDWALWHTRSSIELQLSLSAWPPLARLQCRFALRDLDQAPAGNKPQNLNGLRWMLVDHTARALGVLLRREDETGVCVTQLEFPLIQRAIALELPEVTADKGRDTQPFAGWLAMVVSADPEFQRKVSEIMQPLGWAVDHVHSVDEAFQHCLDALPQAIVVDGALAGADLRQWRYHVLADAPGFCFIEVSERPELGNRRADDGLHCPANALERELPALLREALTPPGEALTFRI
jgi:hypothetical protein